MPIRWLASYPKCGNTWVRFLLYTYRHGFPRRSGDVGRRIIDIHTDAVPAPDRRVRYVKTHHRFSRDHPLIGHTDRVVYLIRHPKDVARSFINWRRLTGGFTHGSEVAYLRAFAESGGDPDLDIAPFAANARSWLGQIDYPVVRIRYEDLLADTEREMSHLLRFLEVPIRTVRLKRTVAACSFAAMRAFEQGEKARGRSSKVLPGTAADGANGWLFINRASATGSLADISADLDRLFDERFADVMSLAGYEASARPC